MTATRIVMTAAAAVLAVEVMMWTASAVSTHLWPGGFTLFGAVGALVLVRVAKGMAGAGVQERAPANDDDE